MQIKAKKKVKVLVARPNQLFAAELTVIHQACLSMGFLGNSG